jgi:hypothetical protein
MYAIVSVSMRSELPLTRKKNTLVERLLESGFVVMIERVLKVSTSVTGGRKVCSGIWSVDKITEGSKYLFYCQQSTSFGLSGI